MGTDQGRCGKTPSELMSENQTSTVKIREETFVIKVCNTFLNILTEYLIGTLLPNVEPERTPIPAL